MASTVIVQQYFDKKRPLAAGMASMGQSIASFSTGPIYTLLIYQYGWRGALIIHAGFVLHAVVLGASFRPLNPSRGLHPKNVTAREVKTSDTCILFKWLDITLLKQGTFILYLIGFSTFMFAVTTVYNLTPSRAIHAGMSKMEGAMLLSCLGLFSTTSRFINSFIATMRCTNRFIQISLATFIGGVVACLSTFCSDFPSNAVSAALYGVRMMYMCIHTLCVDICMCASLSGD
jgi:MFS family permease